MTHPFPLKPVPEPGWSDEIQVLVVKVTEHWVVGVTPMIYNDRIVLMPRDHWDTTVIAGWCYDKGGAAPLAAMVWDPETDLRPVGFKKESHDGRSLL